MPTIFDRHFSELSREFSGMCDMVVQAIQLAIDAFLQRDREKALLVTQGDDAIDLRENTIDELCRRLLVLNHPYAGDFRRLISFVKANHSLERIGDHAKSLARCVIKQHEDEHWFVAPELRTMLSIVKEMIQGCVRALLDDDADLAAAVVKQDKEVNVAYDQAMETYAAYLQERPQSAALILGLAEATKHLERCGDLAKNISKDVIYSAKGKNVRHGGRSDMDT